VTFLRINDILTKLNTSTIFRKPFCHIRFGDGGIKFLHAVLTRDLEQLNQILEKEGIPLEKVIYVFEEWGHAARIADCIDTPQVYFDGSFWPRIKKRNRTISKTTSQKMSVWRDLYRRSEFDNDCFCNPESNYLMLLRNLPLTLLDVLKGRKICVITARPEVRVVLQSLVKEVDIVPIVSQWQNHFNVCFDSVIDRIKTTANDYDFWLVAAGELGRIYSGKIKENGGRSVDVGFVIDYWLDRKIHPRLQPFMQPSVVNRLQLVLTEEGKKYLENI